MTERIKIKNISMENFGQPRLIINCNDSNDCAKIKKQILDDQEKAEKLDKYENENWIAIERKVWDLERQENKQLKEDKNTLSKTLVEEVELGGKQRQEIDNLKQKLEKIEPFFVVLDLIEIYLSKSHQNSSAIAIKRIKKHLIELKEILEEK